VIAALQPGAYTTTISDNLANDSGELTRITNNFLQTGLYLDYRQRPASVLFGSLPTQGRLLNYQIYCKSQANAPIKLIKCTHGESGPADFMRIHYKACGEPAASARM
jgi:hypothetical protein